MPSTTPYVPTWDFTSDTSPQDRVNAQALQTQLNLISSNLSDLMTALGISIRDDDTLTDLLVRLRNLHPELSNYLSSIGTGTVLTNSLAYYYPVRAASDGTNIASLIDLQTLDGVALAEGDRVLLKDQTAPSENGLWIVHAIGGPVVTGIWSRASDLPAGTEAPSGWAVDVREGTLNAGTAWAISNGGSLSQTVGTDALVFFSVFGNYPISVAHGGTGGTTPATARAGIGAAGKAVGTITGDGVLTLFNVAHTLGTADLVVGVRATATGAQTGVSTTTTTTNVAVTFSTPPAIGEVFTVAIIG